MALPNFIDRAATAASQVLANFDLAAFTATLDDHVIGLAFDGAAASAEAVATLDLATRLLARLYPAIAILPLAREAKETARCLTRLARAINPDLSVRRSPGSVTVCVVVGATDPGLGCPTFFAGSDGWIAKLSTTNPVVSGATRIPFGAGAAACLATANVFRAIFAPQLPGGTPDGDVALSLLTYEQDGRAGPVPACEAADLGDAHLVGLGAIGNGAVWALARMPHLSGTLHLVDHEAVDLFNLQRYVLAGQAEVGVSKVEIAAAALRGTALSAVPHPNRWDGYLGGRSDWRFERVAVALDTAEDRSAVQAALPRWIVNAWTQDIDLGVSRHGFDDGRACLACLYLPSGKVLDEDARVAEELGMPEELPEIRRLLQTNAAVEASFVGRIATALGVPPEPLLPFAGQPLRSFYQKAICGGLAFRLSGGKRPVRAVVPMVFQSALAGIMLAADLVKDAAGVPAPVATSTRVNLLRPLGAYLQDPHARDRSGRCICSDADFVEAYRRKYAA